MKNQNVSNFSVEDIRKLFEIHGPRGLYRILSTGILPLCEAGDDGSPKPEPEPRKIKIDENNLKRTRTISCGPVTLPSQEMARQWLKLWQNGLRREET